MSESKSENIKSEDIKSENKCEIKSFELAFVPCTGVDTAEDKLAKAFSKGVKRKCLASTHSPSVAEWQLMRCRRKRQKFQVEVHSNVKDVTIQAKPPKPLEGEQPIVEMDIDEGKDPEICHEVKPANRLACQACLGWANNARFIAGACRLHALLDLACLLEARLTSPQEEQQILDYMMDCDYMQHAKVRHVIDT